MLAIHLLRHLSAADTEVKIFVGLGVMGMSIPGPRRLSNILWTIIFVAGVEIIAWAIFTALWFRFFGALILLGAVLEFWIATRPPLFEASGKARWLLSISAALLATAGVFLGIALAPELSRTTVRLVKVTVSGSPSYPTVTISGAAFVDLHARTQTQAPKAAVVTSPLIVRETSTSISIRMQTVGMRAT
jgi:hypothetical protein